ncbi:hypothetical protein OAB80_00270 [Flavobacteriaceae bacterium]|nr:hypothetical protein [Flavobacteriaceae bacterium]
MSEAVNSKNIGGWSPFSTPTHEDLNIFNEAMQGNIGVAFTPQQVSTQLVYGMNYKFKCKAITTGTQKPTTLLVMIQIFAPADGSSPSIISNTVINPKPEPTNGNKPSGDKAVQYLANNQWQFQLNQDNDLICILTSGSQSKKVEIHTLTASSGYKNFSQHIATAYDELHTDNCQFLIAENDDLVGVWTNGTGSGKTEVHILSASSGYKNRLLDIATCLDETGDNFQFLIAENRDIYAIKKSKTGTNKTEVHILSAAHNYQRYSLETGTILHETGSNWTFALADNNDLVGVMKSNTRSKMTEVHILDHTTNYQSYKLQQATILQEVGDNFSFFISKNLELFAIKENNTGTATTEVHIMNPATKYTTWILETGTGLPEVNDETPTLKSGEIALFSGINQTGRSWKINGDLSNLSSLSSLITPFYSIDLGLQTCVNIYQDSSYQGAEHTYINKANLNGISFDSLKLWNNYSLAKTGISYSSLMTEDYQYNKNQPPKLEKFNSFQTIITFPSDVTSVDVYAGKEVVITVDDTDFTIDNVKSQTFQIQIGQKLLITTPATQLGSSYYRINTNTMEDDEFVLVFPDAHLHNKIANLPKGNLNKNRKTLNLASSLTSSDCDTIQSALSNIAKSVTYPAGDILVENQLNSQSMEHNHWSLDFSAENPTYQSLTKSESAKILKDSTPLNGNGEAWSWDDLNPIHIAKVTFHTVVHGVEKVADAGENFVKSEAQKASELYHSAITTCNDLEKGDFSGAAHSVESGLSDAAHMAADVANGPITVIGAAMPTQLVKKTVLATLHFADKSVSFVVNHTGVVGHVLGYVIKKIGADVDKAIDWLKHELGWDNILRIQGKYNGMFNSLTHNLPGVMKGLKKDIDTALNEVKQGVNNSIVQIENELHIPSSTGTGPSSTEVNHRLNWLFQKLMQHADGGSGASGNKPTASEQLSNALIAYLQKVDLKIVDSVVDKFVQTSEAIIKEVDQPGYSPEQLLRAYLNGLKTVSDDILDVAELTANFIIDQSEEIVNSIAQEVSQEVQLPFFTDLFRLVFPNEKLSLLNLSTIGPAIAVSISYPNCAKGQTLALSTTTEANWVKELIWGINVGVSVIVPIHDVADPKSGLDKLGNTIVNGARLIRNVINFAYSPAIINDTHHARICGGIAFIGPSVSLIKPLLSQMIIAKPKLVLYGGKSMTNEEYLKQREKEGAAPTTQQRFENAFDKILAAIPIMSNSATAAFGIYLVASNGKVKPSSFAPIVTPAQPAVSGVLKWVKQVEARVIADVELGAAVMLFSDPNLD